MQKYLIRKLSRRDEKRKAAGEPVSAVAHLWDGTDTACRMWSTGGITNKGRFQVSPTPEGRPICQMCRGEQLDEQWRQAVERDPDRNPQPNP